MTLNFASATKSLRSNFRLLGSYLKVNWKLFLASLCIGLLAIYFLPRLPQLLPKSKDTVGIVGNFTIGSLPLEIQKEISFGLTKLGPDQAATSGAAISWTATDSGKVFVFKLDPNLFWQDGTKFDTSQVNYSLKGVSVKRLSLSEIEFKFQKPFAPLPAVVSQPIFKNGLVGLGDNKLESVKFNGKFLSELTLENQKTGEHKTYKFYPTEAEAATALKLGSVRKVERLHDDFDLANEPHFKVTSATSSGTVAALFLNLNKGKFNDKAFRQALDYALPDTFENGSVAYSSIQDTNWARGDDVKPYVQNLELAKEALGGNATGSAAKKTPIIISTVAELKPVAETIAKAWTKAGQQTKVETAGLLPPSFDVYLSYMTIPPDPDQYALWHSTQRGNIASYNSPKVDKLLEEGRQTLDPKERKRIYGEFQKALSEDLPAIFLFYPKLYTIERT